MKISNVLAVGLAAMVGFSIQAEAQEKKPSLKARVVRKAKDGDKARAKMQELDIVASTKAGYYTYQKDVDTTADVAIEKNFSTFYVLTPPNLIEAKKLYAAESFAEALPKLAAARKSLENWRGLPEGPYLQAFRMEVECAIRMMDFAAAKQAAESFPEDMKKLLTKQDQVLIATAKALAAASKKPGAKVEEYVNSLLSNGELKKAVTPKLYGWLQFAIGVAYENGVPAEERSGYAITDANAKAASKAIDCYCRAGMSSHGAQMELPVEGLKRAQALLWGMPGVQKEAKNFGHPTPEKFKKASQNFQDAVILAYMLINVYGVEPEKSSIINKAAALFQNTKSKKK